MSLFRNFINTTYDYLSPQNSPPQHTIDIEPLSRQSSTASTSPLKERLDAACLSPTSSLAHLSPTSMRRELDVSKHELARVRTDSTRLEERCKMLEKTLKETRELLRTREVELEKLRRERDRERAMAERRRSDVGPQYHRHAPSPPNGSAGSGSQIMYPRYSSSLDTRLTAADIGREIQQMNGLNGRTHLHEDDARSAVSSRMRTPSPQTSSPATSTLASGTNGHAPSNGHGEEDRARARSAETYMTRIDGWSGAQVLQAVHDINSEILQFAASATEMCSFAPPSSSSSSRNAQAMADTTARIGPHMARILATRDHSQDPLLVQLALQGCVSLCIARALSSFCIGFPSKSDAVLAQIYSHMHLNEPQPTSAKWRALTHQHIHSIYPTLTDYSVSELSDTILRWAADICLISNGKSLPPSATPSPPSSSPPTARSSPTIPSHPQKNPATHLRTLYLDQIKRISMSVLRLAKVTREDIMSTSFELAIADPTVPYDAAEMGDAFGEYGESRGHVLITMELGLRCLTRVGPLVINGNETPGKGDVSVEGMFEQRLLLQPKVVLESVLEVLDR